MSWTIVQAKSAGVVSSPTLSVTLDSVPTPENLLVAIVGSRGSGSAITTPTGFDPSITTGDWGAGRSACFTRVVQPGDSATVTTGNGLTNPKVMRVYEVSGLTASPVDVANPANPVGGVPSWTITAGSATAQADELVFAYIVTRPADMTFTWDSGFTDDGDYPGGAGTTGVMLGVAYKGLSAVGTPSTTATRASGSDSTGAGIITLKVSAGGGPVSGSAALSGSGSLSTTQKPGEAGTAALSGSGTLATAGTPAIPAAASFGGAGALTTAPVAGLAGTAGLSGDGTLDGAGKAELAEDAGLTGDGTLGATGSASEGGQGTAALSGSGTLTADEQSMTASGSAGLSGAGTLTAHGSPAEQVAAAFNGDGTLTAAALTLLIQGSAALSGDGQLEAVGTPGGQRRNLTWTAGVPRILWTAGAPRAG